MAKLGRPRNSVKIEDRFSAIKFLETQDQAAQWRKFLKDPKTALPAWLYLNDRGYGKAPQSVKVEGELEVVLKRVVSDL